MSPENRRRTVGFKAMQGPVAKLSFRNQFLSLRLLWISFAQNTKLKQFPVSTLLKNEQETDDVEFPFYQCKTKSRKQHCSGIHICLTGKLTIANEHP